MVCFKNCIGELCPKFNVMTLNVVHTYAQMEQLRRPTNYYNYKDGRRLKITGDYTLYN